MYVFLLALLLIGGVANADQAANVMAEIQITNLTTGQGFSPPAIVVHNSNFKLFAVGEVASPAIRMIAEEGDASEAQKLTANADVASVTVGEMIAPGETKKFLVSVPLGFKISLAMMLGTTNDGFSGILGFPVPQRGYYYDLKRSAYDAGTEENNEKCGFIPGPPCNSHGVRSPARAEGTIGMHKGIMGTGDLSKSQFGWSGSVAEIKIRMAD